MDLCRLISQGNHDDGDDVRSFTPELLRSELQLNSCGKLLTSSAGQAVNVGASSLTVSNNLKSGHSRRRHNNTDVVLSFMLSPYSGNSSVLQGLKNETCTPVERSCGSETLLLKVCRKNFDKMT